MKKVAIVKDCKECPFFIDHEYDVVEKSQCKKAKIWGNQKDIFNVCPLPNYEDDYVYDWEQENILKKKDGFWSWGKNYED